MIDQGQIILPGAFDIINLEIYCLNCSEPALKTGEYSARKVSITGSKFDKFPRFIDHANVIEIKQSLFSNCHTLIVSNEYFAALTIIDTDFSELQTLVNAAVDTAIFDGLRVSHVWIQTSFFQLRTETLQLENCVFSNLFNNDESFIRLEVTGDQAVNLKGNEFYAIHAGLALLHLVGPQNGTDLIFENNNITRVTSQERHRIFKFENFETVSFINNEISLPELQSFHIFHGDDHRSVSFQGDRFSTFPPVLNSNLLMDLYRHDAYIHGVSQDSIVLAQNLPNITVKNVTAYNLDLKTFLFAFDSNVLIDSCRFQNITATVGTALIVTQSRRQENIIEVKNSVFEDLHAELAAGAILINADATVEVTILDSLFQNVSALDDGGIFYAQGQAQVHMRNLQIDNCASYTGQAGFAFFMNCEASLSHISINNCSSSDSMILAKRTRSFTIEHSVFHNNVAIMGTNGIRLETSDEWESDVPRNAPIETARYAKILNCEFSQAADMRDFTQIEGGFVSISINNEDETYLSILNNFNVPQVLIANSSFVNGLAMNGGAIYSDGYTNLELRSCYFDYNRAQQYGGAIYTKTSYRSRIVIDGTTFIYNIAGDIGCNIYIMDNMAPYGSFTTAQISNKIQPIPVDDEDGYMIDQMSKWSEVSIANVRSFSPSGIIPVQIIGMRLVRLTNVVFENSNDYAETLSLFGGSMNLLNVVQLKVNNCKFLGQSSLLAGGAINYLENSVSNLRIEEVWDNPLTSYIKDSVFEDCQSARGGAFYYQPTQGNIEIIGSSFTNNRVIKKRYVFSGGLDRFGTNGILTPLHNSFLQEFMDQTALIMENHNRGRRNLRQLVEENSWIEPELIENDCGQELFCYMAVSLSNFERGSSIYYDSNFQETDEVKMIIKSDTTFFNDTQLTSDMNIEQHPSASNPVYFTSIEPIYLGSQDVDSIFEQPVIFRSVDYLAVPPEVDVTRLQVGDNLSMFSTFQNYIDGIISIRGANYNVSKQLFGFPIVTIDQDGLFILNNDTTLLLSIDMPKSQVSTMPKFFYGDQEMLQFRYNQNVFRISIYYEALRFSDGILDASQIRFYGFPGHNYTIRYNFEPYGTTHVAGQNKIELFTRHCTLGERLDDQFNCQTCEGYSYKLWLPGQSYEPSQCFECQDEYSNCADGYHVTAKKGFQKIFPQTASVIAQNHLNHSESLHLSDAFVACEEYGGEQPCLEDNKCLKGYKGSRCNQCANGFFKQYDGRCSECLVTGGLHRFIRILSTFVVFLILYLIFRTFAIGQQENYHSPLKQQLVFLVDFVVLAALLITSTGRILHNSQLEPKGMFKMIDLRLQVLFTTDCIESSEPLVDDIGELDFNYTVDESGVVPWEFRTDYGTEAYDFSPADEDVGVLSPQRHKFFVRIWVIVIFLAVCIACQRLIVIRHEQLENERRQIVRSKYATYYKLQDEFHDLLNSQYDIELVDDDVFEWRVRIKGLEDSELERATFLVSLEFSKQYPNISPKVKFVTKMFHPNVDRAGYVHAGFLTDNWVSKNTVAVLIGNIKRLLLEPDLNHCVNREAEAMFLNNHNTYLHKFYSYISNSSNDWNAPNEGGSDVQSDNQMPDFEGGDSRSGSKAEERNTFAR